MTMLDRMRRHKGWLKWSLALVVVAFILLYIPSFLGQEDNGQGGPTNDSVAVVNGHRITIDEFQRAYQGQLQMYRNAYGGNINEQLLRQLGIDRQVLQQMIDTQAALDEARRLHIEVSNAELAEHILTNPAFQENGRFIGQERYAALLRMQRPPMTVDQFEQQLRDGLVVDKLRSAVTAWMTVTGKEVDAEFQRRNEKVKLDLVVFPADKYRADVKVTDAELAAYFDAHKEQYRIGERRKIRYVLIDIDALRASSQPTASQVQRFYADNIELYSTPEQVRASHILFKTDGKDDAAVKAKAEKVLAEIKAGADFAAMAKKYSEDEASAKLGGDLDYFPRGKMAPEFDDAAFALQVGEVSGVVKTPYGYDIIKVTDKKPASTRPLDEVRPQIVDQLSYEAAAAKATDMAGKLAPQITKPADLDKAAAANGLKVQESGFFTRDEPILGLGPAPQATAEAFSLNVGQVSGAIQTSRGYVFLTPVATEAPRLPTLDEVKERVREDLTKEKAKAIARDKALAFIASLKGSTDLAKGAKAAGVEVKTTDLIARGAPLPEIGASPQVDNVAFALPADTLSGPITTDNAVVVVKVLEHRQPTPAEIAAGQDQLRTEMLNARRDRFFAAYMQKVKAKMKIDVNAENLQKVAGQ